MRASQARGPIAAYWTASLGGSLGDIMKRF
jgi:hypothetical protein